MQSTFKLNNESATDGVNGLVYGGHLNRIKSHSLDVLSRGAQSQIFSEHK